MTISTRKLSFTSVASLFALLGVCAVGAGCAQPTGNDKVGARLTVLGTAGSALSASDISSISGTYGGACADHASDGTDGWLLAAGTSTLAVAKDDTDCVLTIQYISSGELTWTGTPAIALDSANTWKDAPSVFASSGQASFYANAKISALSFAADFGITLLVSDTPSARTSDKAATFGTVNGSVTSQTVPAPDYTIDTSHMDIEKDADAVVLSTSGFVQLLPDLVDGQDYAVYLGSLSGACASVQARPRLE